MSDDVAAKTAAATRIERKKYPTQMARNMHKN